MAIALSLSAAVLCGCGGAAENAPVPSPAAKAAVKDKKHQFEAAKADCMKQKGFKYVPFVHETGPKDEAERKRDTGDYQAMRQYREKYGFGVFSMHVYPDEAGNPVTDSAKDPNMKVQGALSIAQLKAYHKAKDACVRQAAQQVLGLTLTSNMDYYNEVTLAHKRVKTKELDGDARLVELAGTMATCLKGKGYPITDTRPTAVESRGKNQFLQQQDELGREQFEPKSLPPGMTKETKTVVMPTLSPQEARTYLDKEIKAALDDLECGKDFYAAYVPRETALQQQVNDQYAL
ncbi:hypothetical protein GCM10023334_015170 [Nonomuraea thailandensis]